MFVPAGTLDASDIVTVEQAVIDNYLPQQPADRTIVRTDEGESLRVRRGAPIHMSPGLVEGAAAQAVGHHRRAGRPLIWRAGSTAGRVRNVPADGTLIKAQRRRVHGSRAACRCPTRACVVCRSTLRRSPTPVAKDLVAPREVEPANGLWSDQVTY